GSVKQPQERNGWVRAERDHFTPKAAGVKANRTLDALSDGAFAATPERSRSHREAQHAKLRPSTQQRDIVPYQSTLSGENKAQRDALGPVVVLYMEQIDGSQTSAET